MNYLLSVIIPTKNRSKYCIAAIRQILDLNYSEIQIVVQDNSNTSLLINEPWIANTPNIKYHYTAKTLSFVDNFNEAVLLADGEYLCIIGDDDGILPNIIEVAKMALNNKADAVIPALGSVYMWPTETPIVSGGEKGYLCLSYINRKISWAKPQKGLIKLLANGGQNYQNYDMPRLYHGLVHKSVIEEIKQKNQTYFGGLTPDIYISTVLALTCKHVLKLGFPITVSGICPTSGSSDSATGKHTGELKNAPHFIGHDTYQWFEQIPAVYTVETIWAETILHALQDFQPTLIERFNTTALISICRYKYPQFRQEFRKVIRENKISSVSMTYHTIMNKYFPYLKIIARRLTRKKTDVIKLYNIEDISSAVFETDKINCMLFSKAEEAVIESNE